MLYSRLLDEGMQYKQKCVTVKSVLNLSHGNADVERVFLINSDLIVENLVQETAVAQRKVFHFINNSREVCNRLK